MLGNDVKPHDNIRILIFQPKFQENMLKLLSKCMYMESNLLLPYNTLTIFHFKKEF